MNMDGTTIIRKTVDEVFAYVIDLSNDVHWRNGVDESGLRSGDPVDKGSIGYTRVGDLEVEWRVIDYVPGERVEWELLDGPFRGTGGYRLVPVGGGTEFTLLSDVQPSGLLRLLGPVFAWVGQRRNRADAERLRHILEAS